MDVMVHVGMAIITSREVTWDAAQRGDEPSLGPGAGTRTAVIHISKSSEPLIYGEFRAT